MAAISVHRQSKEEKKDNVANGSHQDWRRERDNGFPATHVYDASASRPC